MKIKGLIEIEIEDEKEYIEKNDLTSKDEILARFLTNPEDIMQYDGARIEVSNVVWVEQPQDESFETEEEDETEEETETE